MKGRKQCQSAGVRSTCREKSNVIVVYSVILDAGATGYVFGAVTWHGGRSR